MDFAHELVAHVRQILRRRVSAMDGSRTFLRFTGRLWDDMRFEPGLGWETVRIAHAPRRSPEFQLELLDDAERLLAGVSPEVSYGDCRSVLTQMRWANVAGYLPFRAEAASIVFRKEQIVIHRERVAHQPPRIAIRTLQVAANGRVHVSWEASHERPLRYMVRYLTGRTSYLVVRDGRDTEATIETSQWPGGGAGCRIAVLASDGLRSAFAVSDVFDAAMKAPRVFILFPADRDSLAPGQPASACGQAINSFGRSCPDDKLVWSLDGTPLVRGVRMALIPPLEPGEHRIGLNLVEGERTLASETVVVQVLEATPELLLSKN
jgi:hypothetical protein